MEKEIVDKLFIVIPAKDEAPRIGKLLAATLELGYSNIIVVDDGSTDNTAQIAESYGVHVVQHLVNMGAGASTQTGIDFALKNKATYIATIDADFQLFPSEIGRLLQELIKGNHDVVIGNRFHNRRGNIPFHRIIYNKIGNWITFLLSGLLVEDSQCGLKVFKASYAKKAKLHYNGFEFCVEFIQNIKYNNASYKFIPINVAYTEETLKKGQSLQSGLMMLVKLFSNLPILRKL